MEIAKVYDPEKVEEKWYSYWLENKCFSAQPNSEKEPYSIVIPPPNVTGVLHMGHMLNNTIQDVLVRKARMEGKEAVWVPGTDHASIATEAKVVAMLKEQGIEKSELNREDFLKHAWEWKEKYGGIILEQLKKLGCSCDWDRTAFTMDENLSKSVIKVFVDLYNKGLIFKGIRMVNWDPAGQTALSDEEVIHKEENSRLFHIKYKVVGEDKHIIVATTRPETLMGDTAVCINPNDERYTWLKGKKVIVPLVNREVDIIEDEYVDLEFGTGCLKVTPAHDLNDYELGMKHNLKVIDIFNDDGTLNENAEVFVGEDRFVARKKIAKELKNLDLLEKIEDIKNKVGHSERTDAVIEPKISTQWFLKMEDLAKPALENVMNDSIQLHPPKFKNTYRHWMENVKDWCISRQLWWGHRIPAYYLEDGTYIVAETDEKALELAKEKSGNPELQLSDLRQDEDVLDTWFSSGVWPITVFDGLEKPGNDEIKYFYPTTDLVTAPEILFFWVARMIIAGYEYMGEMPFKNVYLTGIVRDSKRRKMSKSLGNSPDPLDLIAKYSADGVRTGMLFSSPAGNDLLFDEKLCEQGRNYCNKIWNAFRLIKGWDVDESQKGSEFAVEWFKNKMNQAIIQYNADLQNYRLSDALIVIYKLIWNDFCSSYLEMIKPEYGKPISKNVFDASVDFLDELMKMIHPFMPFISEEIWHLNREGRKENSLMVEKWPTSDAFDQSKVDAGDKLIDLVTQIRNFRSEKGISPKDSLDIHVKKSNEWKLDKGQSELKRLANINEIIFVSEQPAKSQVLLIGTNEVFIEFGDFVDSEAEKDNLQKELDYLNGFIKSVEKKLNNDKFVNNAPEQVVNNERKKLSDALQKKTAIEESLTLL